MGTSTSSAVRQLSDGNSVGTVLGQSAADLIGFYGTAAPVARPSGAAQALVVRGQAVGSIATIATSQSPAVVASFANVEGAITVITTPSSWQIASGDLVYVNKPTSQAGLGVGNVRVSGGNSLGVTFTNFSNVSITPTAGEKYGVVAIRGMQTLTASLSPAVVAPNSIAEQQFTITPLRVGELVQVSKPTRQAGLDVVGCRVAGANTLGITFANVTAATITPTAAETYTIFALGGLDAVSNEILINANIGAAPVVVATITCAEQAFAITGLATTDAVKGVSKPTAQTIGIANARVSGTNSLGLSFVNPTAAGVTPTASEQYNISINRPNPVAPLLIYTAALSPGAVASQTTSEQAFTVTGLISSTPVWVNKPSATPGIGIAGCRVSGTNSLAITFCNATTSSITPPAETYVIGNFQLPIPDNQATWVMTASPVQQNTSILGNALRAALTSLNLLAGA